VDKDQHRRQNKTSRLLYAYAAQVIHLIACLYTLPWYTYHRYPVL